MAMRKGALISRAVSNTAIPPTMDFVSIGIIERAPFYTHGWKRGEDLNSPVHEMLPHTGSSACSLEKRVVNRGHSLY